VVLEFQICRIVSACSRIPGKLRVKSIQCTSLYWVICRHRLSDGFLVSYFSDELAELLESATSRRLAADNILSGQLPFNRAVDDMNHLE